MPRTCTVCGHADRDAIDAALVTGEPLRNIAARYVTSTATLLRHKAAHLPASLAAAQGAQEAAHGDDLIAQVRVLQGKALAILAKAEAAGQLNVALQGVREARGCLELLARLLGELQETGPTVNFLVMPEWLTLRTRLLIALDPYPDARLAVAAAMQEVGHARK
jgi:hypothetical protein